MGPEGQPGLLRLLAPAGGDLMFVLAARDGKVVDVNEAACRALGYTREELLEQHAPDFSVMPSPQAFARAWRTLETEGAESRVVNGFRRRDGSTFPADVRFALRTLGDERMVLAVARETPPLPPLEAALRHAEHDYESILRNLPGIVYRATTAGEVHWIDGRVEELTGHPPSAFLSGRVRPRDLMDPAEGNRMRAEIAASLSARDSYDLTYGIVRADGERRIVRDIAHIAHVAPADGDGPVVVEGILFDITRRVEEERILREALAAEHRRYQQVVAASGQVVYEQDVPAGVMHYSASLFDVFGYTVAAHGTSPEDWRAKVHPDDLERVLAEGRRAAAERRTINVEYRYRHARGGYRWVWDRSECDYDETGAPARVIGVMQDVTERRELEAQVRAAQRMETIGALTGSVAHDLNNFLTSVLVNLAMARMQLGPEGDMPEIQDAADAATKGAELVRSLLSFARQEPRREPIDAGALVSESLRLLMQMAGREVRLQANVREGCPPFEGDRVQVQQVLMNLVVNARDAMGGRGSVTIEVEPVAAEHRETGEQGEFVRLEVADSGPGIPAELHERIFQPYFTTRAPGEGTGLGLSIVHSVAQAHGGWVEVSSAPGQGARFAVYFPVAV